MRLNLAALAGGLALLGNLALADAPPLRFSLLRTAVTPAVPEAMVTASGSWMQRSASNHVAVLVQHGSERFLFDTGLGRQAKIQFSQDMPYWIRPLMEFKMQQPARDQLDAAGISINRIYLSHTHWDHLGGAVDFPDADVYTPAAEQVYMRTDTPPRVLPSQVLAPNLRWRALPLQDQPYQGFARSFDVFGDGSVVMVALPGHTPGSVGMFLNLSPQKRFLFVGDAVWRVKELEDHSRKAWPARAIVDADAEQTLSTIDLIRQAQQLPGLSIVPAHDTEVHDKLAYFPAWVE